MDTLCSNYDKLAKIFKQIKAENDVDLIENSSKIFVYLTAAERIRNLGPYIAVGRKGSGKTAVISEFKSSEGNNYDIIVDIIADQENSWALYNLYYSKFIEAREKINDLPDLFDLQTLFATAWAAALQVTLMQKIIENEEQLSVGFPEEIEDIRDFLLNEFEIEQTKPETRIADRVHSLLPAIFELIQLKIDSLLASVNTGKNIGIVISRFTKWITDTIESRLVPISAKDSLKKIINGAELKILITLDKYDDYVDTLIQELDDDSKLRQRLRKSHVSHAEKIYERANMLNFQRGMLRGLLLATKELRENDYLPSLHYAFAIPHDRYIELGLRESAQYDTNIKEKIEWNPFHLLEYFVRRCLFVLGIEREFYDCNDLLKVYREVLKKLEINEFIQNETILDAREDFFLYLLRHTMWRPRDLQRYLTKFFDILHKKSINGTGYDSDEILRDVVKDISPIILDDEFYKEYMVEYPSLEDVIMRFRQRINVLDDETLRNKILGRREITLNHNRMKTDEVITRLYNVGFLGIRSTKNLNPKTCIRQNNMSVYYCFYYNEDIKNINNIFGGGNTLKDSERWVVHPIFYDRLDSDVAKDYVIHEMNWTSLCSEYGAFYHACYGNDKRKCQTSTCG